MLGIRRNLCFCGLIYCAATFAVSASFADDAPRFGRDVLPILSQHCFACHGPDASHREADLRLDVEVDAKAVHDGKAAIVPSDVSASTLVQRIESKDPDQVMPPPSAHRELTPEQIATLKAWIAGGAKWGKHWSFEPLDAALVQEVASSKEPQATAAGIDRRVSAQLKSRGLAMQPAAAPQTLVRRLYLDLIGLPPSPEVAEKFASNPSPEAYRELVSQLLKSPQFGEHWGKMWLDLARYADTKGYEKDLGRSIWPYRDWVIKALNDDMPLDEFTRLQLAGDLLPNAGEAALIATAFHRNTMSNDEGGTDDEEFRTVAVKDRIDTTMQVWMGLTMGCAKCHSHKYDPITMQEYYSFYAIFNQTEDADRYDDAPVHRYLTESRQQERESLLEKVKEQRKRLEQAERQQVGKPWTADIVWAVPKVIAATTEGGAVLEVQPDGSLVASGSLPERDAYDVELQLEPGTYTSLRIEATTDRLAGKGALGVGRSDKDRNFVLSELSAVLVKANDSGTDRPLEFKQAKADFSQEGWPVANAIDGKLDTGWAVSPKANERHAAVFELAEPLKLEAAGRVRVRMEQRYGGGLVLLRPRVSVSGAAFEKLEPFAEGVALADVRKLQDEAEKQLKDFDAATPAVPVMRELAADKKRVTKVHTRGNFLEPGDEVQPAIPQAFHGLPAGAPLNRLGVAAWLTDAQNPLTPRVWANRIWARLFGIGIVETEEDFGALGSAPSDHDLLDYLAVAYRDQGWSLKKLLQVIVLSDAYRQSSVTPAALREVDPRNSAISRGARYRLSAEVIRDQALAVSGLLSLKQGGPPVMPPQPDGLWRSTYNGQKWINAENEDRWRRSVYTYWKRTTPYPSLVTFDAGSREVCQIRRITTNTPLQALVTLNDPVYLEASGALGRLMLDQPTVDQSSDVASQIAWGMQRALLRPVTNAEVQPLVKLYLQMRDDYHADAAAAKQFIASGRVEAGQRAPEEVAAMMAVANAILNLDELLTRN